MITHSVIFRTFALSLITFSMAGCIDAVPNNNNTTQFSWNELFEVRDNQSHSLYALKSFSVVGDCPILPAHYSLTAGKKLNRDYIAYEAESYLRWAFDDNPVKGWTFTARYSDKHNLYDIISCQ